MLLRKILETIKELMGVKVLCGGVEGKGMVGFVDGLWGKMHLSLSCTLVMVSLCGFGNCSIL